MAQYSFISRWAFDAPLATVWEEITHPLHWPAWWRGLESVVETRPADADGLGSIRRFTWRSRLRYRLIVELRTTRVVQHQLLEAEAMGELRGTGRWTMHEEGETTHVRYDWSVDATRQWMRLLAPVARPVFTWNHNVIMRWGQEGLRHHLSSGSCAL